MSRTIGSAGSFHVSTHCGPASAGPDRLVVDLSTSHWTVQLTRSEAKELGGLLLKADSWSDVDGDAGDRDMLEALSAENKRLKANLDGMRVSLLEIVRSVR